jgi:hypothetical protein
MGQPQIVHHQLAGLVLEHAIDAGDSLHQPVATHRLVNVYRVQRGGVKAGEPHVAYEYHPQRISGIPEPVCQSLAPRLVADVRLPVRRIGRRAGHHHFDSAALIVVVVPGRAQPYQFAV